MKYLLATLSAVFGAIPGFAVLTMGIGTPPGKQIVYGGLVEAFGVLTLLVLYVNRGKLKRIAKKKISRYATILGLLALTSVIAYFPLYSWCVVASNKFPPWEQYGPVYFPLWLGGEAKLLVEKHGGRQAAIDEIGPRGMHDVLNRMPSATIAYFLTDVAFVVLFLSVFTSLTAAFGVAGFHLVDLFDSPTPQHTREQ